MRSVGAQSGAAHCHGVLQPGSFARDAALLADGGYDCDWVQVIDQFRMSNHIELVARFSRI